MKTIVLKRAKRPTSVPLSRIRKAVSAAYKTTSLKSTKNTSPLLIRITKRAISKKVATN